MRNRTEAVTNQLGSDFEEEGSDFEADSGEEDWKPDPEEKKGKKTPKRKATATKTSAKKKKTKKEESNDESEEEEEDEEFDEDEGEGEDDEEIETSQRSAGGTRKPKKTTSEADARNFPDRQGVFSLYAYKGDLKNGLRANTSICLWRRDGQSLLQKYLRDKDSGNSIFFNSSMVYSCWEDRRKEEFLEVKVKCVANTGKDSSRDSKVELLDVDTIEQTCIDGRFHELDLEPYVSYADKKKEEDAMNGTQTSQVQDEEEEEVSEGEE